jgi:PAS domain S-box-containing protein
VISSFAGRGQIEYVNPYAAVFTGLPIDDLRRVATWASLIHPDDLATMGSVRHAVFTNNTWSGQVRMQRPDGVLRHVELRVRGRQSDPQAERQFVLTLLDVTDRVEAQEREQQTSHLVGLARTSGAFAHEFNNLLQIISGNLESISVDDPEGYLAAAKAATARAATLVAGLGAFASGRPTDVGIVGIAEMCSRVKAQIRAGLPASVDMAIDIPDDLPFALADEADLFQIVAHLVTNAVEAMPDGGTLAIAVDETTEAHCHMSHAADERCWVRIRVSDTGRGIAPDRLAHVWEPFHSTKKGSAARGAGLGLSTVHGLVHQFEGHVTIASTEGVGTTVTISLPGVHG